jgi:hypothetical protein
MPDKASIARPALAGFEITLVENSNGLADSGIHQHPQ